MNALVIGASGFIGANLTAKLLEEKWKVKVLVRSKETKLKKEDVYVGDIANLNLLRKATKGVDVVFNCAAALPHHKLLDEEYYKTNVSGLKNILEAVKGSKTTLVHLSTVGIYDSLRDAYVKTKIKGESLIREYEKKFKVRAVIIRPTIAYGPGDTRPGFLNLFRLIKKGIFPLVGKGENFFHTVYVDNLCQALVLAAKKRDAFGDDFIIGDGKVLRMREILEEMTKILDKKPIRFYLPRTLAFFFLPGRRVRFLTEDRKYKIDKARRVLGYKPKIGLKLGLQKTYDWYRLKGYL